MRFLLVTGMSGAGKTTAMRYLEDMGAFVVDNIPPMVMGSLMEACETTAMDAPFVALAVDVRSGQFFNALAVVRLMADMTEQGCRIDTLFMDSSDEVLVRRYKESRREHPLAGEQVSLVAAIARERELLTPLRETANYVLDPSAMKPRELQRSLRAIVESEPETSPLRIEIVSFGFKRGVPIQADLVWDVRFLPNPFYIEGLGQHTGLDEDVRAFVMEHPVTMEFMERTEGMLDFLLPHYQEEGKHRLVIAVGCTGGCHRSVAIAQAVGNYLHQAGYQVNITHRDMDIEQARWTAAE